MSVKVEIQDSRKSEDPTSKFPSGLSSAVDNRHLQGIIDFAGNDVQDFTEVFAVELAVALVLHAQAQKGVEPSAHKDGQFFMVDPL